MIKICFVTTIYSTYKSFLKKYSNYLHSTGEYEISLICNNEFDDGEELPEYVHFYPINMKRGLDLSAPSVILKMNRIFREKQFDIVQYSTPNAAFYASIAAKMACIPVRLYCQWGIRYMGFAGLRRTLFKYIERKTCNNSTFVEAESQNIRGFSIEEGLYPSIKSCVIGNGSACGVDLSKFDVSQKNAWREVIRSKLDLQESDVVFAFAGRLTADKGVNELLLAFLNISAEFDNVKLLVIGRMDDGKSLDKELLLNAQKSKDILFTGNVDNIEQYYAAADVFVAPSYREGFGLVVVEAEAMGLPAIVSDVPGQIDAINPGVTGVVCKVKDAKDLAQTMKNMLVDDERIHMGDAAEKFARTGFEQQRLFAMLKEHRDFLVKRGKDDAKN